MPVRVRVRDGRLVWGPTEIAVVAFGFIVGTSAAFAMFAVAVWVAVQVLQWTGAL